MNKDENTPYVVKRTFEDTITSQESLREFLEKLIKENRCLTDEEKPVFFKLISHATLGLGRDFSFQIKISESHGFENLGSVEYWLRYTAMLKNPYLVFDRKYEAKEIRIPIKVFWTRLLYSLFDIFPLTLDRASSMSKEIPVTVTGEGYEFKPTDTK